MTPAQLAALVTIDEQVRNPEATRRPSGFSDPSALLNLASRTS